ALRLPDRAHGGNEPDPHVLRRALGTLDLRAVLDGGGGALRPRRRSVRARERGRRPGDDAAARGTTSAPARALQPGAAGVRGPIPDERPDRAGGAGRPRAGRVGGVAENTPTSEGPWIG